MYNMQHTALLDTEEHREKRTYIIHMASYYVTVGTYTYTSRALLFRGHIIQAHSFFLIRSGIILS
jgi:hypothetical protein